MNSTTDRAFEMLNHQCATVRPEMRCAAVGCGFADQESVIGPAKLLPVQPGQKVSGSVSYFYTEDAPGTAYDNLGILVGEILVSMAASAPGVAPLTEGQLMQLANGNTSAAGDIFNFLATEIDTTTMGRPQGYLVYLAYDNQLNLVTSNSGALQVENPNQLEHLLTQELTIQNDGFLHVYVSNGSSDKEINFDNFLITTAKGKARQINHYYPYGLRISGQNGGSEEYKNMYTSKELQTGEFEPSVSTGLEMYDFHARFYDPQLGRWFAPDPAEQFHNPYLAMGNNPVMYVDPNGEEIFTAIMIGAMIGAMTSGYSGASNTQILASAGIGALAGAAGGSAASLVKGTGFLAGAAKGGLAGFSGGFVSGAGNAWVDGADLGEGLKSGLKGGAVGAAGGAVIGGVTGGISAYKKGDHFWTGDDVQIGRTQMGFSNKPVPANKIYMARATPEGGIKPISMTNFANLDKYPADLQIQIKEQLRNSLYPGSEESFKVASLANSKGKVLVLSEGHIPRGQRVSIINPNALKQTVIYGAGTEGIKAASFYDVNSLEFMMSPPLSRIPAGQIRGNTILNFEVTQPFDNFIYFYVP